MVTDRQIAERQDYGDKSLILCRFYCILLGRVAVLRTLMRPIVTDRVAWSVGLTVRRFVTVVNPAKNGGTDRDAVWVVRSDGPREPLLDGGGVKYPMGRGNFDGEVAFHCKVYRHSAVICVKRLSRSRCHLGCALEWTPGITY